MQLHREDLVQQRSEGWSIGLAGNNADGKEGKGRCQ